MTKEKFNDLIKSIRKQDKSAFNKLYKEYYPKMLYVAKCVTCDYEDACDAVQQAFIKFWKYVIESERPYLEYPDSYLYTIARRCALDVRLENAEYKSYESMETLVRDDSYEERQLYMIDIERAIQNLKEPEQTIAMQFFLFNMKVKEIAQNVDESIGTVKWRLSEIRKYFEKVLK